MGGPSDHLVKHQRLCLTYTLAYTPYTAIDKTHLTEVLRCNFYKYNFYLVLRRSVSEAKSKAPKTQQDNTMRSLRKVSVMSA